MIDRSGHSRGNREGPTEEGGRACGGGGGGFTFYLPYGPPNPRPRGPCLQMPPGLPMSRGAPPVSMYPLSGRHG